MWAVELQGLTRLPRPQEIVGFWWYELDSPVELKTKHICIKTPPKILVFDGHYKRSSVQHLVFSGGDGALDHFVCSIIQREHVQKGIVELKDVPFLSPADTLKVYRRIVGKSETVRTSDLEVITGRYPWPDKPLGRSLAP
jgi:hypothetical protein|tara:strand:+ start:1722 stop:2141 length:420 start_codon:yes stop_codon:yes gene_type:complete